jgi:uncharacterized membrane protein
MLKNNKFSNSALKNKSRQKGVVLIFMSLVITFVILPLTALVIDLGRIIITLRQAQNLADVAATAGVQYLGKKCITNSFLSCNDVNNWATLNGWQSVKPAIKAITLGIPVSGLERFSSTNYFNYGSSQTLQDLPNYDRQDISTTNNFIEINAKRVAYCYDGTNLVARQIEGINNAYCLANAVEVVVTVKKFPTFFGQIIGNNLLENKYRTATAHLRWVPNACGQPSCLLIDAALALPSPCS